MSKNRVATISFFTLAFICYFIYQETKIPDGLTPMSGKGDAISIWAYWGGVFAVIASVIGLVREVIGLVRDLKKRHD